MHPEIFQVVEDVYRDHAIRVIVEAIAYQPWYGRDARDLAWLRRYLEHLFDCGLVQRRHLELCGLAAARHRKGAGTGEKRNSEGVLALDDIVMLRSLCRLANHVAGRTPDPGEEEARCRRVFRLFVTGHRDPAEILSLVASAP